MMAGKILSIQVLRFIAAAMVVFAHAVDLALAHSGRPSLAWRHFDNLGAAGVDVFFVISGFIITTVAQRQTPRAFVAHRLRRIFPIYWLMAAPWALLAVVGHWVGWERLLTTITLWPVWLHGVRTPYLDVGWTLSFELLFYAAMAAVLAGVRPRLLLAAFAACWGLRLWLGWPIFQFLGNPIIMEFLAGVVIARCWTGKSNPAIGVVAGLLALAFYVALGVYGYGEISESQHTLDATASLARAAIFGPPAILAMLAALHLSEALTGRVARLLSLLGDASYATYLVHLSVFWIIGYVLERISAVPADLIVLLGVVAGTAAGVAVHLGVEKPLARIGRGSGFVRPSAGA